MLRAQLLVIATLIAFVARARADAPWLYGIHWYGNPAASHVEQMTGGRGIWSLETVLTNGDVWAGPVWLRDNIFETEVARGHTIIVRIQPNWGENMPFAPHLAQYVFDVHAAAQDLASVCHIWQIGNEPNLSGEWGGAVMTPAQYVSMFRQIRDAIRSVNSPLGPQIVLPAPPSPGDVIGGVRHTAGNDWLLQICDLLTPEEIDGFALHGYAAPWHDVTDSRNEFLAGTLTQLAILDTKGLANKPVFVTEWARVVDPIDAAQESISAQFLSGALADLAAWNATPGAHSIASMCWFVYPFDAGGWQSFSIEYLRSAGPPGPANDLFDAFAFAASQDYPAAWPPAAAPPEMSSAPPTGTNAARNPATIATTSSGDGALAIDGVVSVASKWTSSGAPPPHWLQIDLGRSRLVTGFTLRNAGAAGEPTYFNTEAFLFETSASAAPPTPAGPWDVDALVYNVGGQNVVSRSYAAPRILRHVRLRVVDGGIDDYARVPEFEVYALRPPGDMDNDGDVDAADWRFFRFCLRGPDADYVAGNSCRSGGDSDGDADVDLADLAAFQRGFGQY